MINITTGAPFDMVAMDILDTKITTKHDHRYILVISDYFTKWTDAFPLRRHTALDVARVLVSRFVVYFGVPRVIHSDQGPEFESNLIRALTDLLQCTKSRTTSYRPQSDGQVERANRSILQMLSTYVNERATDWDEHLPFVMSAYRSTAHASTGCTPYSMVFGREMTLPVDLMYPTAAETADHPNCPSEYVEWVRKSLATAHDFARATLHKSATRQKRGYDARAKARPPFNVGDKVRYYYPPAKQGNKMAAPWKGPFTILKQVTDVDYRIQLDANPNRVIVTHLDNLKPWEGDLSMDIRLQTAPLEDVPVVDTRQGTPMTPDQQMAYLLGLPPDSPGSDPDESDQDQDLHRATRRSKRKRRPPRRYGWD